MAGSEEAACECSSTTVSRPKQALHLTNRSICLGLGEVPSQVGADEHIMDMDMDTTSLMPVESYFPETGKLQWYSEGEFGEILWDLQVFHTTCLGPIVCPD